MFLLACLSLLKKNSRCVRARELRITFVKGLEFPCLFIEERKGMYSWSIVIAVHMQNEKKD